MKTTSSNSLQFQLFDKIKKLLPASASFADEMAEILDVSKDSAYRRFRGETALTIDEVYKLCHHYKISFDSLCLNNSDTVSFDYDSLKLNEDGLKEYLLSIYETLSLINKAPEKQFTYLAVDIPIFHHFGFPQLAAFKIFYWLKLVMNAPSFEGKKFDMKGISEELTEIGRKIYKEYMSIPSVEIWTESTVLSTIKQIEYCWEAGQFQKSADSLTVCSQFIQELELIQKQAEFNNKIISDDMPKLNNKNYMLYNCEIEVGNNCILVKTGDLKTVYMTHMTFNKLVTPHAGFCNDTEIWLQNLIKKSILISGSSEKQRYRFFSKALASVKKLIGKIEQSTE